MKRLLLSLAVGVLLPLAASAQIISSSQIITTETRQKSPLKYQQSVEASLYGVIDDDGMENTIFGVDYIGGVRFSNLFYLGAGVGLQFNSNHGKLFLGGDYGSFYYNDDVPENLVVVPLYLHTRFYLTHTRCQPFVALSVGGQLTGYKKDEQHDWGYNPSCFFINPLVGVSYSINDKAAVYVDLGCMARNAAGNVHFNELEREMQFGFEMNIGCTF